MGAVISNSLFSSVFSAVTEQPYQDFPSSFLPSSSKEAPDKNTSSQRAFMFCSFVPFFTLLWREFHTFLLHKKKSVRLLFRDILHELKPYLHPMVHSTVKIIYIILSLIHYLLNIKHCSQLLIFSPTACTNPLNNSEYISERFATFTLFFFQILSYNQYCKFESFVFWTT